MYVYRRTDPNLWTVGFYGPDGWVAESDFSSTERAAARVNYLNGGSSDYSQVVAAIETAVRELRSDLGATTLYLGDR